MKSSSVAGGAEAGVAGETEEVAFESGSSG